MFDEHNLGRGAKTPREVLDYQVEWVLENNERLNTANWSAQGVEILGPPKEPRILNERLTEAWLTGGTSGEVAKVTIAVTTSGGRILERFFELDVL